MVEVKNINNTSSWVIQKSLSFFACHGDRCHKQIYVKQTNNLHKMISERGE